MIGEVVGGPVGAVAGFKMASTIGMAAQTVLKACVPTNTIRIQCKASQVKDAAIGALTGVAIGALCKETICPKLESKFISTLTNKWDEYWFDLVYIFRWKL